MATPGNRFAKVDQPDPGSVTVSIGGDAGSPSGEVLGPADGTGSGIVLGRDGSLTAHEALAVACHLANELDRSVVVIDPQDRWRPAWGRLEAG